MLTAQEQAEILRIVRRMMRSQRVDLEKKYRGKQHLTQFQWESRRNRERQALVETLKEVG